MSKILLVLIWTIVLIFPQVVQAHVLKTDGDIGAVLHMDPDDDPIANSPTGFFFEFKDRTNKFTPANCNCTFNVFESGKLIYQQPLFQDNSNPSLQNASLFYTFGQKDVYQVQVVGSSLVPNSFQSFTLTYDVRVARQAVLVKSPTNTDNNFFSVHLAHAIIIIGGLIAFGIVIIIRKFQKRS